PAHGRAKRRVLRGRHDRHLLAARRRTGRRHRRRARPRAAVGRRRRRRLARLERRGPAFLRRRQRAAPGRRTHSCRFPPEESSDMRRRVLQAIGASLVAASLPAAHAQKPIELTFYYPIAVGGAVTKTIDQMAADFEKENSDIRVKPVYAGTYQESIVKALTAF